MPTDIIVEQRVRRYSWPEAQLNLWVIMMLVSTGLILGVFANFMSIQNTLGLGTPWLFPYGIVIGALGIVFVVIVAALSAQKRLEPAIVIVGSFILAILWLTGLIETSIMLYGPTSGVSNNCGTYVSGQPYGGVSVASLAWLQQMNICNCWQAVFAFEILGTIFFIWSMFMAYQVSRDDFD